MSERPPAKPAEAPAPPLAGIKVLDLTRVLAGPFCTMNLADMGATVWKVEEPKGGDDTRRFGPPFVHGISTYFLSINRSKKSVALDLKGEAGLAAARALAARADILVENFKPGVAERLGLGYAELAKSNPRLIYCSISGFGHRGLAEHSSKPGYDVVVQGLSGLQHVTGDPNGPPMKAGVSIADLLTGMTAFQAILLALYQRERTGRGQHLDISMLESAVQVLTFQASAWLVAGKNPGRLGNQHASICPYETVRAADGHFNLAVGNDAQFAKLCQLVGRVELAGDPRFSTNRARVENRPALMAELGPLLAAKPVDAWVAALTEAGIPCGPICDVATALAHPQLAARGMLPRVQDPELGEMRFVGSPLPLEGVDRERDPRAPPRLGEHTEEVLRAELGLETKNPA